MKIVLLNPFFEYTTNFHGYMKKIGSILPPIGLAMIGSVVRDEGNDVKIIDGWIENLSADKLVELVLSNNPDIVGIYTNTSSFYYAKEICRLIRLKNENIILVGGGPHSSVIPQRTMEECTEFDFIVVGEGELTFKNLVNFLRDKIEKFDKFVDRNGNSIHTWPSEFKNINGIYFRNNSNGNIMNGKPSEYIQDLDNLPIPAWDLLNIQKYRPSQANYLKLPSLTLLTSRGCPYKCSFCSKPLGYEVRFQGAKKIFDEISYLIENYKVKEIIFEDDCFTLNKTRLYELFDLFKQNSIDIKWSCLTRVNIIDKELLSAMKKNGCWRIGYGVESGNEEILKKIQKISDKQKVIDAFKLTKNVGINIRAFFILGSIYETHSSIRETINFSKQLNPDMAQFSFYVPYPGTPDYNFAVKNNMIDPQYYLKSPVSDYHNLNKLIFIPNNFTEKELKEYQKQALKEFYFRPKYLLNQLKNIKNLTYFKREIKIGWELIKNLIKQENEIE